MVIRNYFIKAQQLNRSPGPFLLGLLNCRNLLLKIIPISGQPINVPLFSNSNKLPVGAQPTLGVAYPEIEILFVTTKKDFEILPHAIMAAQKVTSHHSEITTYLIVPDSECQDARDLVSGMPGKIYVLPESEFFTSKQLIRIRNHFGSRSGWVIQQLLKVEFVSRSGKMGVLVVDSDTILLQPRMWLDSEGRQLLTPSWEWHKPYYDFLEAAGFRKGSITQSFVPHHMLMQPTFMREARTMVGWEEFDSLIEYLVFEGRNDVQSPFCIEFELYAQFMLQRHPDKLEISKWANIGIPRERSELSTQVLEVSRSLVGKFASVSFHAYL